MFIICQIEAAEAIWTDLTRESIAQLCETVSIRNIVMSQSMPITKIMFIERSISPSALCVELYLHLLVLVCIPNLGFINYVPFRIVQLHN